MKEVYVSPVLNVLCFAPVERLAAVAVDSFGNVSGGGPAAIGISDTEVDVTGGSFDNGGEGLPNQ